MPSLEARGLTKRFNSVTALDRVAFRYDRPGAIGYLGPNGAGKTTTLKLFTALLRPSEGQALLDGIDVAVEPKTALWNVGAVVETPEPYPALSGRETLAMIGEFRGLARETIRDRTAVLAKELDLPELDRPTGRLSKGQRQRVVLASVLLAEPSILLLDEPTSGLDPAERVVVRNILRRLKQRDRLILMSSHLLQEVTEICDRVVFVNQGRILLEDTVANVTGRFRVRRLDVEFTAAVAPERAQALAGVTEVEAVAPTHLRLGFEGRPEEQARLLEDCQRLAPVVSFSSSSLTLEDAYLRLIQNPTSAA